MRRALPRGAAGAALGLPVDVLRDTTLLLEDVGGADGRRLSTQVGEARPEAALGVRAGLRAAPGALDPAARRAALLSTTRPFGQVSEQLGSSERQLHRRVERSVGYGPRTLSRILRL